MIIIVGVICVASLAWLHVLDMRDNNPARTTPTRAQRRAWKRGRLSLDGENRRRS